MSKLENSFDNRFGILVAFVMLAGFIGDILIHLAAMHLKFPFNKRWFAQGLIPYFKSMEIKKSKISGYFLSGLAGGIACVIGLIIGQLFLYAYDSNTDTI
jgi:hypothetical protein